MQRFGGSQAARQASGSLVLPSHPASQAAACPAKHAEQAARTHTEADAMDGWFTRPKQNEAEAADNNNTITEQRQKWLFEGRAILKHDSC